MTARIQQLGAALAGRYAIDREIGRGGMATVFLARDLRHERAVALKVLDPELGAVLGVDRFLAEIRVTAKLQHPNLLPLFDSGEANGLLFYVMPYVEGESLRAKLERDKQLPVEEAVAIAIGVASALEYAHARGVIHRDLKPENILLQSGQPVVADFGIALAVSNAGGTRVTQTGLSLGTPQYMSPEQAAGDRQLDGRSDVYSLSAVLYEMLAGEPPHSGQTIQAIIARVLTEHPRSVRALRSTVPEEMEMVIARGLEKLPADRWRNAREFSDALQGKAVPVPTRTPAALRAARTHSTWRGRLRDPWTIALGALAVAGVVTSLVLWRTRSIEDPGFVVRVPIEVGRAPAEGGWFSMIAISPDGKTIAYPQRTDRIGLWIRSIDSLSGRLVAPAALMPFFSPDGEWLGFRTPTRRLMKVRLSGGAPSPILDSDTMSTINGASWAAGGVIVVSIANRLMLVPESGGTPERFIPIDSASGEIGQRAPRVLPDGKTVLFESWRGDAMESRIGVARLGSTSSTILDVGGTTPLGVLEGHLIYGTAAGSVMAVPFDLGRTRVTGSPVLLMDGVDAARSGLVRAAMSGTGTLVHAMGSSHTQVVLADSQGATRLLVEQPQNYSSPRFSPDGNRLVYVVDDDERADVWIRDLSSGTSSKLTREGSRNTRPEWHPDGRRILYVSNRDSGRTQLWLQNADMSGSAELVQSAGTAGRSRRAPPTLGTFSPADARDLVVIAGSDIAYLKLGVDSVRNAIATTIGELAPRISPDGKWVAYAATGQPEIEVFVQPFPPTGARTKVTEGGGMTPVWSPDGKRLYYVWAGGLHVAEVRTTPDFAVTSRKELFRGDFELMVPPSANYDVSPDGRHFVLLRPVNSGERLIVAHNWKQELRARVRQ